MLIHIYTLHILYMRMSHIHKFYTQTYTHSSKEKYLTLHYTMKEKKMFKTSGLVGKKAFKFIYD